MNAITSNVLPFSTFFIFYILSILSIRSMTNSLVKGPYWRDCPDISDSHNRAAQVHFTVAILSQVFSLYTLFLLVSEINHVWYLTIACFACAIWATVGVACVNYDYGTSFIGHLFLLTAVITTVLGVVTCVYTFEVQRSFPQYTSSKIVASVPLANSHEEATTGNGYLSNDLSILYYVHRSSLGGDEINSIDLGHPQIILISDPSRQRIDTKEVIVRRMYPNDHGKYVLPKEIDRYTEYVVYLTEDGFRTHLAPPDID